jgi:hypothetical protein
MNRYEAFTDRRIWHIKELYTNSPYEEILAHDISEAIDIYRKLHNIKSTYILVGGY